LAYGAVLTPEDYDCAHRKKKNGMLQGRRQKMISGLRWHVWAPEILVSRGRE